MHGIDSLGPPLAALVLLGLLAVAGLALAAARRERSFVDGESDARCIVCRDTRPSADTWLFSPLGGASRTRLYACMTHQPGEITAAARRLRTTYASRGHVRAMRALARLTKH